MVVSLSLSNSSLLQLSCSRCNSLCVVYPFAIFLSNLINNGSTTGILLVIMMFGLDIYTFIIFLGDTLEVIFRQIGLIQ